MPGSIDFDDDDAFLQLPLFPLDEGLGYGRVSDDRWELPVAWMREYETRPKSQRTLIFDNPINKNLSHLQMAAAIFVRRAAYLELFRSRKPYAIATLRQNVRFYRAVASFAVLSNKLVCSLDYNDLLQIISNLPKVIRSRAPQIHEMMRWWQAFSPETFTGYTAPPTINSISTEADLSRGFNPQHIRDDDSCVNEPDKCWQPLPDDFVAHMGEFMMWVSNVLRPIHLQFIEELAPFGPAPTLEQIKVTAASYDWPDGYAIDGKPSALRVGNICQSSAMFLISLLLGPRWSELTSIPKDCLTKLSDGSFLIDGSTFKYSQNLSGEMRDWPVHPELAKALVQQQRYIDLTETDEFPFFWRSHSTIFASGEPVRQSGRLLERMVTNADCEALLDGSTFHHHRFRKTTARLIVIALHGGPLVLRRLFGHEHLGVTLRYILANSGIVEELREIAQEEQRLLAQKFVERRSELRGGGAKAFNKAVDRVAQLPEVSVPKGKRDQNAILTEDILDLLSEESAESLMLKQIVPGLIVCFKPPAEAGLCCKAGELPNVSKCSMDCNWHLEMPEYVNEARSHLVTALAALRFEKPGSLRWLFYSDIARAKLKSFSELMTDFADDPVVRQIMGGA